MNIDEITILDKAYYMNTFGDRFPICFTHGQQATLYSCEGNAYVDFGAGIAVNTLGYNHPILTQAIIEQAKKLIHCSNLYYIESQTKLARMLVQNSCCDKVFLCNSGTEANEAAIKLARKYYYNKKQKRYEVISTLNSFHGRTLGSLAATGQEKYQKPFRPLPDGFKHVTFNNFEAIQSAISDKTCAILIELIQGEGGIIPADKDYITSIRKLCDDEGILLIIDEVQTGIARTGKLFCYEHYNIFPDIITLAKGLGGGMPIGAMLAKKNVAEAFSPGDHGTTFGGNPLASTCACAVLSTIIEDNLFTEALKKGEYLKDRLKSLADKHPSVIDDVRGFGLMLGLKLADSINNKRIVQEALDRGFLILTAGDNCVRFVPPLIIKIKEIDMLTTCLDDILSIITNNK